MRGVDRKRGKVDGRKFEVWKSVIKVLKVDCGPGKAIA
jgi:hypothetical protein